MRLKMKPLLFNIVIIAYLISNCGNSPMDVVNKGQLQMRISFAEEINKASTLIESAIVDRRITVTVFNSNGGVIASSDLTQNGTRWQGEIKLDPADDLTVKAEVFDEFVLHYTGSRSGVNVKAGQNTQVEIPLFNVESHNIFNIQLSPPSPASLAFNEDVECTFDYTTPESGVQIFGFPFSNGSLTPNYVVVSGAPLYPVGSGNGTASFTITSGNANVNVDQIEFKMFNADQSQILLRIFIPVMYNFSP